MFDLYAYKQEVDLAHYHIFQMVSFTTALARLL